MPLDADDSTTIKKARTELSEEIVQLGDTAGLGSPKPAAMEVLNMALQDSIKNKDDEKEKQLAEDKKFREFINAAVERNK